MTFPAQIMTPDTAAAVEMVPLGAIPAEWNMAWADLASTASEPNPFVERWFIQPAIHNLTTHADDQMLAVWQNTKLVGLLPLSLLPWHAARSCGFRSNVLGSRAQIAR
jgi:hypothetical protein